MKKIIIILFLFLLCYTCYYIYVKTEKTTINIASIGDNISVNKYLYKEKIIDKYDITFTNNDYRIIDILNIFQNNKEINNKNIHQVLKKSDIIIVSIGMNDIYYKLNNESKEIYTYLNDIINNYDKILTIINKYTYKQVIILGYYNINNKQNDIFTYINYKLKKIATNYNYTYIDLNKEFYNNKKILIKEDNYYLNDIGIKQINKIILEKIKKYWYNIKSIYYYDLY